MRRARRLYPLAHPVRVRRVELEDGCAVHHAVFDADGKLMRHEIAIDRRLARDSAIDALLHEWAHALVEEDAAFAMERGHEDEAELRAAVEGPVDHPAVFWMTFGALYRSWCRAVGEVA